MTCLDMFEKLYNNNLSMAYIVTALKLSGFSQEEIRSQIPVEYLSFVSMFDIKNEVNKLTNN